MTNFQKQETVDKPGIIGARWWQESVATQVPRRQAMTGLLVLGGVLGAMAAIGTCVSVVARSPSSGSSSGGTSGDVTFTPKSSLEMQKEFGWSFGATDEALVFDGQSTQAFDRTAIARLPDDLAPSETRHTPYFVATLFQAPTALPKSVPTGETDAPPVAPLKDALVPVSNYLTQTAFEQGRALASLLDKEPRAKDLAVIVDLQGPEAVAFAAGASSVLDPIFLFDNWPHPRAVVPAHMTLASAVYYQPLFAKARAARPKGARPMFVLDRKRLASYTDEASQFDNRHTAKLPSVANLTALGVKNVLYVAPNAVERSELDDLNDDFVSFSGKIAIHTIPATAFEQDSSSSSLSTPSTPNKPDASAAAAGPYAGPYFYGGSKSSHGTFWTHWTSPTVGLGTNNVQSYTPSPRPTPFSSGAPGVTSHPRPVNFGTVPVAVAVGTGVILGARLSRSGSWNRTSSYSSSSGGS